MISEKYIWDLVQQKTVSGDIFIVDIKVSTGNKITIWVDKDQGVTIDECVGISRYVENQLDRETEDFDLEVSSAGLEIPFKVHRQYKKNLNKMVVVTLTDNTKIKGKLVAVSDEGIEIEYVKRKDKKIKGGKEKLTVSFMFDQIKTTKAVIEFK